MHKGMVKRAKHGGEGAAYSGFRARCKRANTPVALAFRTPLSVLGGESAMILPVTLTSCAAAGLICIWLGMRIGRLRGEFKVSIGDGGHEPLARRMRAQLNFVEYTPFVILLIAGIELADSGGQWLPYVAGIYMLGRVAHPFGMDMTKSPAVPRMIGTMITMLTLLGLSVYAVLVATGVV